MKVKYITLLTVAALVALLFVGGAAAVTFDSQASNEAADITKLSATYSTSADSTYKTGVVTGSALKAADGVVEAAKAQAAVVSTASNLASDADNAKTEAQIYGAKEATFALNTENAQNAAAKTDASSVVVKSENAQNAAAKVETSLVAATADMVQNPAAKLVLNDDDKRRLILNGVTYLVAAKETAASNSDSTVTFNDNVYRKATPAQLAELRNLENIAPAELAKAFTVMTSNSGKKLLLNNAVYEKIADDNNAAELKSAAELKKTTVSNSDENCVLLNGATYKKAGVSNADAVVTEASRADGYRQIRNSMFKSGVTSATNNMAAAAPAKL